MVYINHIFGMISKQQLKVFNVFKTNIFKEWTFNEIKKALKEKSNNKLQISLKMFQEEGLINLKKIGKTNVYSVSLNNNKVFAYFSLCFLEFPPSKIPFKTLYNLQEAVEKTTELFCFIVFGSFAKGQIKNDSDFDVAILVENEEIKKLVVPSLETVKRKEILKIDYNIFTNDEFLEMLLSKHENVGKEIFRNHFIFYNTESFYRLVIRAFGYGFNG